MRNRFPCYWKYKTHLRVVVKDADGDAGSRAAAGQQVQAESDISN